MMERGSALHTEKNDIHKAITEGGTASHRKLGQLNIITISITTIMIYVIHPSRKLKLLFDCTTKNISQ